MYPLYHSTYYLDPPPSLPPPPLFIPPLTPFLSTLNSSRPPFPLPSPQPPSPFLPFRTPSSPQPPSPLPSGLPFPFSPQPPSPLPSGLPPSPLPSGLSSSHLPLSLPSLFPSISLPFFLSCYLTCCGKSWMPPPHDMSRCLCLPQWLPHDLLAHQ